MADPNPPELEAMKVVIDFLDSARRRQPPALAHAYLTLFNDGCGTITIATHKFGSAARPIAEGYAEARAWLADTDEATRALDSELGESVDHIFLGAAP